MNLRRRFAALDLTAILLLGSLIVFFGIFLFYPISFVFKGSLYTGGRFSLSFFKTIFLNPLYRASLTNSLLLGVVTTVGTTILALPLALIMGKFDFPGKRWLGGVLLLPMIMPPFVGAIGMKQILARYGSVNLLYGRVVEIISALLVSVGILETQITPAPIDFLVEGKFWGVVILEVLHLYPIMYLNVAAALANIDPSLEEAARNLGASGVGLFRKITFPLILPGYFAGAAIVFIWAFTDLGTPLIFNFKKVLAYQIFNTVTDIQANPMGYALVVLVLSFTLILFYGAKKFLGTRKFEMTLRGAPAKVWRRPSPKVWLLFYIFIFSLLAVSLLPHISVVLTSISQKWFMTVLPEEVTGRFYIALGRHHLAFLSIKNSLLYSSLATVLDLILGVTIAYLLTRKVFPGASLLDAVAMLPLALPGLVLAFGYVAAFSGTFLDPRSNPTCLLVISYAVRRLPYMVRAGVAGFEQVSRSHEEASLSLGATPFRTIRKITLPLIFANLVAGVILCFSFAMLAVSDSLILAIKENFYPITKTIYHLAMRLGDGPFIASAMGVLGMALLAVSLIVASSLLGKRMGELFHA